LNDAHKGDAMSWRSSLFPHSPAAATAPTRSISAASPTTASKTTTSSTTSSELVEKKAAEIETEKQREKQAGLATAP